MNASLTASQPYQIRVSSRGRTVRLRICPIRGLEVVVPQGFDCTRIPRLLAEQEGWIARATADAARKREALPPGHADPLPKALDLRALEERWGIEYRRDGPFQGALERPGRQLMLGGKGAEEHRSALRTWLKAHTRRRLVPRLEAASLRLALPFKRSAVRGQKTRWASCSGQGTITLNYKMLFLPPSLVQYLFVHELCHTRHLNHSPRFWGEVERHLPRYQDYERRLQESWRFVPYWVDLD